jgi:YfiH family protein
VFAFRDEDGRVEIAFTDRHRGVGDRPSASLDLSPRALEGQGPDGAAGVLELVTRALTRHPYDGAAAPGTARRHPGSGTPTPSALTPRVALMHQVHGSDVSVVDEESLRRDDAPVADALVTRLPGVVLVVRVADCVPVLLADPEAGVLAAVHAGRAGVAAGVVPRAVDVMRDAGASRIRAWVGPHVCGACYEVPSSMREEVAAVVPEAWAETTRGTPALDLGAGVLAQLSRHDVEVRDLSRCTVEHEDLFSFRRQGTHSGRLGGLIWMRS